MLTKNPTVWTKVGEEFVRAAIPMLLIFDVIHWTEAQTGAVMLFVGVLVGGVSALIVNSQTTTSAEANALIRTAIKEAPDTSVEKVREIQAKKDAGENV